MRLIFFREKDLEIMGMSDGSVSMDFPYVIIEDNYHTTENLAIERDGNEYKLKVIKT